LGAGAEAHAAHLALDHRRQLQVAQLALDEQAVGIDRRGRQLGLAHPGQRHALEIGRACAAARRDQPGGEKPQDGAHQTARVSERNIAGVTAKGSIDSISSRVRFCGAIPST
jgi:hypothetical protein